MGQRGFVGAVVVAALLGSGVSATADEAHGFGGVRLEVLSGPARFVSGGAARVRVSVPRGVAPGDVRVAVNGRERVASGEPRKTLADFLREECGLTGTHLGC